MMIFLFSDTKLLDQGLVIADTSSFEIIEQTATFTNKFKQSKP